MSIRSINKISISLILSLLYKEVEIVTSSKEIIIEKILINAIKTVSINSELKK